MKDFTKEVQIMRESEVKNIIAVEILDKMNDQGGASVLREILFNPKIKLIGKILEVTLFKSICQN